MLRLERISKNYGEVSALADVSLTLAAGESLALVGTSGSGKTTLSKIAVGMAAPDRGQVLLDGRPLAPSFRRRSFADCADIQYIFQDPYSALIPEYSVEKNLEETARICRRRRRPCLSPAEALGYVDPGLTQYLSAPVGTLSGGQRQKVCIARGIMPAPRVIIADEATSMLDKESEGDVFALLDRIRRERGIAVISILHDIDFSAGWWDRIAVMWRGQLVESCPFSSFRQDAVHSYSRELLAAYDYFRCP